MLLADLVLIVHAGFVGFVVFGLPVTIAGGLIGWRWIGNPWFRFIHLGAIAVVVVQAWFGVVCPLTVWENELRVAAGQSVYEVGFIATWLHRIIFFQAEPWVFTLAYTTFGAAVAFTFWWRPTRLGLRAGGRVDPQP